MPFVASISNRLPSAEHYIAVIEQERLASFRQPDPRITKAAIHFVIAVTSSGAEGLSTGDLRRDCGTHRPGGITYRVFEQDFPHDEPSTKKWILVTGITSKSRFL